MTFLTPGERDWIATLPAREATFVTEFIETFDASVVDDLAVVPSPRARGAGSTPPAAIPLPDSLFGGYTRKEAA